MRVHYNEDLTNTDIPALKRTTVIQL